MAENKFDLIICDLTMPDMTGWEVFEQLNTICKEKDLKKPFFIMLTGWNGQALDKEKMVECRVDGISYKPLKHVFAHPLPAPPNLLRPVLIETVCAIDIAVGP